MGQTEREKMVGVAVSEPVVAFGFRAQRGEDFVAEVRQELGATVRSAFSGRFVHEIVNVKPKRDWLLKNVFLAKTLCFVIGSPGSGKSFLLLDLAMTMALAVVDPKAAREWFGRKIKPCGIIYVAGEGQEDFVIRVQAWLLAKGLPLDTRIPFYLVPKAVDLRSSGETVAKFIAEIGDVAKVMRAEWGCDPGLVPVDTFNKALAGGDDGNAKDVGPLMANLAAIKEATGATVIAVHHTAKNSKTNDPRGLGSIRGDNDAEIFVRGPDGPVPNTWMVERAKGAPRGDTHEFRLRQFKLDRDEDGDAITSCIVAAGGLVGSSEAQAMQDADEAARTGKPNMTADGRIFLQPNAHAAMRALNSVVKQEGNDKDRVLPPAGVRVPYGSVAVAEDKWFEEFVRIMPGYIAPDVDKKESDKHRDRCRKAFKTAVLKFSERNLAGIDQGWVWRTNRRVVGIDPPERDEFAPRANGPTAEQLGITEEDIDNMLR